MREVENDKQISINHAALRAEKEFPEQASHIEHALFGERLGEMGMLITMLRFGIRWGL